MSMCSLWSCGSLSLSHRRVLGSKRGIFAGACSVPVTEIIAVEETHVHEKQSSSGRWQKMENPFAFTGEGASVSTRPHFSSM